MTVPATPPTVEPFDATDVIATKRDGVILADTQIDWVMEVCTRGAVAEEQMSALAMVIYLRDTSRAGIARQTEIMIASGEHMDFSGLLRPTADKHSARRVGDRITLLLAPLVAVFGASVPQLSRRGLGHTGGTLDKLESVPGWQAELTGKEVLAMLGADGPDVVICAAGAGLAPADKRLYALHDTTATVSCIPLIASPIMSRKIVEGTRALVLDVKVGPDAFMKEFGQARELASTVVALGTGAGVTTYALLADMSTPLGRTAGNAPEIAESLKVLTSGGPADIVDLIVALALKMCVAAGRPVKEDATRAALADGRAMDIWCNMISRQGRDPNAPLPLAPETETTTAPADGVLTALDVLAVGVAVWRLGAGRARKEDPVQAVADVTMHAKPGGEVHTGQPLLTLHTTTPERFTRAREVLADDVIISEAGSSEAANVVARHQRGVILERIG